MSFMSVLSHIFFFLLGFVLFILSCLFIFFRLLVVIPSKNSEEKKDSGEKDSGKETEMSFGDYENLYQKKFTIWEDYVFLGSSLGTWKRQYALLKEPGVFLFYNPQKKGKGRKACEEGCGNLTAFALLEQTSFLLPLSKTRFGQSYCMFVSHSLCLPIFAMKPSCSFLSSTCPSYSPSSFFALAFTTDEARRQCSASLQRCGSEKLKSLSDTPEILNESLFLFEIDQESNTDESQKSSEGFKSRSASHSQIADWEKSPTKGKTFETDRPLQVVKGKPEKEREKKGWVGFKGSHTTAKRPAGLPRFLTHREKKLAKEGEIKKGDRWSGGSGSEGRLDRERSITLTGPMGSPSLSSPSLSPSPSPSPSPSLSPSPLSSSSFSLSNPALPSAIDEKNGESIEEENHSTESPTLSPTELPSSLQNSDDISFDDQETETQATETQGTETQEMETEENDLSEEEMESDSDRDERVVEVRKKNLEALQDTRGFSLTDCVVSSDEELAEDKETPPPPQPIPSDPECATDGGKRLKGAWVHGICDCCKSALSMVFYPCRSCSGLICGKCINRGKCHVCAGRKRCPLKKGGLPLPKKDLTPPPLRDGVVQLLVSDSLLSENSGASNPTGKATYSWILIRCRLFGGYLVMTSPQLKREHLAVILWKWKVEKISSVRSLDSAIIYNPENIHPPAQEATAGQKLLDTITGFQKGLKFPTSRSSESDRPRSNSSTPSVTVTSPSGATLPRSTLPVGLNRDFVVIRTDDIKSWTGALNLAFAKTPTFPFPKIGYSSLFEPFLVRPSSPVTTGEGQNVGQGLKEKETETSYMPEPESFPLVGDSALSSQLVLAQRERGDTLFQHFSVKDKATEGNTAELMSFGALKFENEDGEEGGEEGSSQKKKKRDAVFDRLYPPNQDIYFDGNFEVFVRGKWIKTLLVLKQGLIILYHQKKQMDPVAIVNLQGCKVRSKSDYNLSDEDLIEIYHIKNKTIFLPKSRFQPNLKDDDPSKGGTTETAQGTKEVDTGPRGEEEGAEGGMDEEELQLLSFSSSNLLCRVLSDNTPAAPSPSPLMDEEVGKKKSNQKKAKRQRLRNEKEFLTRMWVSHFHRAISRPYYDFLCFSFLFTSVLDEAALTRQQCPILSLFLQRCMLDLTRTSEVAEKIKANLQGKVSRMKRKDFMGPITIEDVSLGTNVPFFSNFRFNDENIASKLQNIYGSISRAYGVPSPAEWPDAQECNTQELLGSMDISYAGGFSVKLSSIFYINFPKPKSITIPFQAYVRVDSIVGNLFLYCSPHQPPSTHLPQQPQPQQQQQFYPSKFTMMFSEMPKTRFSTKLKIGRANPSIFPQISSYFVSSVRKNLWKQCVCPNHLTFHIPLPGQRTSFRVEKVTTRRSAARRAVEREALQKDLADVRQSYDSLS